MLRLRLASLALASGFLFLASGCMSSSSCDDGRWFPRLFRSNSYSAPISGLPGECGCHDGAPFAAPMPPIMDSASMPGAMWQSQSSKNSMPIPITNIPANQPPQFPKVLAQPTPFTPAN